jgi:glycosyltransferase involved in cell wall biosynthesis
MKTLVAIPVYNEEATVEAVVRRVRAHAEHVLLIDDGSTDRTAERIERVRKPIGLDLIRHEGNLGYGHSLRNAFDRAADGGFDWVITMDCDEQHEPDELPAFFEAIEAAGPSGRGGADIISGSRYLDETLDPIGEPPSSRRAINRTITEEINRRLGLALTDGFCGFKAHRVSALQKLALTEDGYAFPMQLWVQLVATGATITERAIRRIYNDPNRTFGGGLDDADHRLAHYRGVMHREICARMASLPAGAANGLMVPCCDDA